MKATEVIIPDSAIDHAKSPNSNGSQIEYAVEAGESVLNHRRYSSFDDAQFYGVALANARDRERCGHVMVKRRVVQRRVTFGEKRVTYQPSVSLVGRSCPTGRRSDAR